MKKLNLTEKTDTELETLLTESRAKAAQIAVDLRTKKVANVKELAGVKRTIARTLTIMRQRQLSAQEVTRG